MAETPTTESPDDERGSLKKAGDNWWTGIVQGGWNDTHARAREIAKEEQEKEARIQKRMKDRAEQQAAAAGPEIFVADMNSLSEDLRRKQAIEKRGQATMEQTQTPAVAEQSAGAAPPPAGTAGQTQTNEATAKLGEKAREAYTKTQDAIVEKLAIELKRDNNIVTLAAMADVSMPTPQNDDEYRRIAKELIQDRKFTSKDKDGNKVEITIEKIDEYLKNLAKDDPEEYKKATDRLKAESLDKKIPDSKRSASIAKAVSDSVEENTGFFSMIKILFSAVIEWFTGLFSKEGGKSFNEAIAGATAKGISDSLEPKLKGLGESPENIKEISDNVRDTVFKTRTGNPEKGAKKLERLEDIPNGVPPVTSSKTPQESLKGNGTAPGGQEANNREGSSAPIVEVDPNKGRNPTTSSPDSSASNQEQSSINASSSAAAVLAAAKAIEEMKVKQSSPAPSGAVLPVVPAADAAAIRTDPASTASQQLNADGQNTPSSSAPSNKNLHPTEITKPAEQQKTTGTASSVTTFPIVGLTGSAQNVVNQIKEGMSHYPASDNHTNEKNTKTTGKNTLIKNNKAAGESHKLIAQDKNRPIEPTPTVKEPIVPAVASTLTSSEPAIKEKKKADNLDKEVSKIVVIIMGPKAAGNEALIKDATDIMTPIIRKNPELIREPKVLGEKLAYALLPKEGENQNTKKGSENLNTPEGRVAQNLREFGKEKKARTDTLIRDGVPGVGEGLITNIVNSLQTYGGRLNYGIAQDEAALVSKAGVTNGPAPFLAAAKPQLGSQQIGLT